MNAGKVYAVATEDMDALTFGSKVLLRHLTFSEARKMPIQEIHLDKVLTDLELSQDQVTSVQCSKLKDSLQLPSYCLLHL